MDRVTMEIRKGYDKTEILFETFDETNHLLRKGRKLVSTRRFKDILSRIKEGLPLPTGFTLKDNKTINMRIGEDSEADLDVGYLKYLVEYAEGK